ncbi:MAG: DUF3592 domain-containing protein [Anaerolineales bacterium]|nr:DUF3592 domain-containing protein [Anaerolineales bacterium]
MTNLTGLICGGGLVLALFIGGGVVIFFGIKNRKKAEASNAWPSAGGMITATWIEENTDHDEDGYSSTTYTPKWEYKYQVGGYEYTSQKISFGGVTGYGRRKRAQEELDKFPANSQVRVYYDPNDPNQSVLIKGTKGTMLGIIIGVILILVSIIIACVGGVSLISNL